MGLYALPSAFVALWKRTEEMNPNVAHPKKKTGLHPQHPRSSYSGDSKCLNLPIAHAWHRALASEEAVRVGVRQGQKETTPPPDTPGTLSSVS